MSRQERRLEQQKPSKAVLRPVELVPLLLELRERLRRVLELPKVVPLLVLAMRVLRRQGRAQPVLLELPKERRRLLPVLCQLRQSVH